MSRGREVEAGSTETVGMKREGTGWMECRRQSQLNGHKDSEGEQ